MYVSCIIKKVNISKQHMRQTKLFELLHVDSPLSLVMQISHFSRFFRPNNKSFHTAAPSSTNVASSLHTQIVVLQRHHHLRGRHTPSDCLPQDLTRFNKICHPSQRPRWQVDKEAIGLSRVQQCSSTYSPPS